MRIPAAGVLGPASVSAAAVWSVAAALAVWERGREIDAADEPPLADGPLVSVILPARNEERAIAESVLAHRSQQYPSLEVVVVDDESTDRTADRARAAAESDPRVRIIDGAPVPDGWVGKSWACHQGAQAARGEWLVFTDADVIHRSDTVGRALACARRLGRGGLTLAPQVQTGSVAERVVLPAAIQLVRTLIAPGPLARARWSPIGVAAGAFIMVRRDIYDQVGGHEALANTMVDDLGLASAIKRSGHLLVPADGTSLLTLRMYRGAADMWRGWRKNAAFALERSRTRGLAPAAALLALGTLPAVAMGVGARRGDLRLGATGALGYAAQWLLQRTAAPVVPTPAIYGPTLPAGTTFLAAAAASGAIDRLTGRGATWRGRRYPLAGGRRSQTASRATMT